MVMDEHTWGRWLCAIGKHVIKYQQGNEATYVHASLRTSQEIDLLLRLRRQGRIPGTKVEALARDCGIPRPEWRDVLTAQQQADLLDAEFDDHGGIVVVVERIFTEQAIYEYAARRFEQRHPEPAERALVPLMDLLCRLPLSDGQIVDRLSTGGFTEEQVRQAIELTEVFGLARRRDVPEFHTSLLYNEYLYAHKLDDVQQVLVGLQDRDTNYMLDLMEEIGQAQGLPMEHLSAAPPHLIKMATAVGLVDAIEIHTQSGKKAFAFSPQFHGLNTGRPNPGLEGISDQVKILVASIQYGMRFSDWTLHSPVAFLTAMVNNGTAGGINGATPIGRDYVLVEKYGILRTVPTWGDRYRFEVVKHDIVVAARDALEQGQLGGGDAGGRALIEQKNYSSPEAVRLGLAEAPGYNAQFEQRCLTAIRQEMTNGSWL